MEIDRLSATVDFTSDKRGIVEYNKSMDHAARDRTTEIGVDVNSTEAKIADEKLDKVAEDRTSTVTVLGNDQSGGLLDLAKGDGVFDIKWDDNFDQKANDFVRKAGEGFQMDIGDNIGKAIKKHGGGGGILALDELKKINGVVEDGFADGVKKSLKRVPIGHWIEQGFTDGAAKAIRKFEGAGIGKMLTMAMPSKNDSGGIFDIFRGAEGGFQVMEKGLKGVAELVGTFETLGEAVGTVGSVITEAGDQMMGVTTTITDMGEEGQKTGKTIGDTVSSAFSSMGTSVAGAAVQIGIYMLMAAVLLPVIIALGAALVALAGYVAGLVAAFAPLLGVLFALPGLILAAMGPLAIFMVIMKEVVPVLQEVWQGLDNTEQATKDYNRSVLSLAQSERSAQKASEDYANARRDAGEAIEDAQRAATGAQLSEERAILSLERAYKRLADVQGKTAKKTDEITKVTDDFTGKQFEVARITFDAVDAQDDMKDALLGVKEAELALAAAKDAKEDTEIRLRELERKGIENSDIMIDRALANVAAQDALAKANEDVLAAMALVQGQGELYANASEPVQTLVDKIVELKPLLEGFADDILTAIGPGLEQAITNITPLVTTLGEVLGPLAGTMGDIAAQVSEVWGDEEFGKGITDFFEANKDNFIIIGQVVADFSKGLLNLAGLAQPVLDEFGKLSGEAGKNFLDWTEGNSSMGDLSDWFELTATVLDKVFDIVGNLVGAFGGFVEAATPFGTWVLDGIVDASEALDSFFNSVEGQEQVASFFERIKPALEAMGTLFGTTLQEIVTVFGSQEAQDFLTKFTNMMNDDLVPAIGNLTEALIDSGFLDQMVVAFGALFGFINLMEPILAPLITGMVTLIELVTLGPLATFLLWIAAGPPAWFENFWDPLKASFIDVINGIIDVWNSISFTFPKMHIKGTNMDIGGQTLAIRGSAGELDYFAGGTKNYGPGTNTGQAGRGGYPGTGSNEESTTGGWVPPGLDVPMPGTVPGINPSASGAEGEAATIIQNFYEKVDPNAVGAATAWALAPATNRNGDTLALTGPR